jgi:hypothetical protein
MVVEFTTTCAISTYHHLCCECESCSLRGVLDKTLCDQVCQWLETGRWFSPGIPVSSTYTSGIKHHKTNQPIIMSFIIIHDSSKVIKLANSVIHIQMLPIRQSHSLRDHGHFDFRIPGPNQNASKPNHLSHSYRNSPEVQMKHLS